MVQRMFGAGKASWFSWQRDKEFGKFLKLLSESEFTEFSELFFLSFLPKKKCRDSPCLSIWLWLSFAR